MLIHKILTPSPSQTVNLKQLSRAEKERLLERLLEKDRRDEVKACKTDFLEYAKYMWPEFIGGDHHRIMADAFNRVANGSCKRLIINMPPRHTKSEFASYLFPSWFLGKLPHKKVIQTSHTAELATGFGRKVRNLVDSEQYKTIFQNVELQADNKAAGEERLV